MARSEGGFSFTEMVVTLMISMIIASFAIPTYETTRSALRISGDLRSLAGLTSQAKLRSAADFTHARVYANLNGGTFQLEDWNKTNSCWVLDGDTTNTCLTFTSGAPSGTVTNLAAGDSFGYGTLTAGPTPGQTTIGQASQCLDNSANAISHTACILFNSRGIPINATTLAPLATGALYVTNGTTVDGVTVSATGSIQSWAISAVTTNATWSAQ